MFILDKSGSMAGLEGDTVGGFNSMLQKQKALGGECRITTALFDSRRIMSESAAAFRESSNLPAAPFAAIRQDMEKCGEKWHDEW